MLQGAPQGTGRRRGPATGARGQDLDPRGCEGVRILTPNKLLAGKAPPPPPGSNSHMAMGWRTERCTNAGKQRLQAGSQAATDRDRNFRWGSIFSRLQSWPQVKARTAIRANTVAHQGAGGAEGVGFGAFLNNREGMERLRMRFVTNSFQGEWCGFRMQHNTPERLKIEAITGTQISLGIFLEGRIVKQKMN